MKEYIFYGGLIIIIGTHGWMLVYGMKQNEIVSHSIVNLIAAGGMYYSR